MDGNERKINTFYAGQIRYRSIIEVSSDHGIGGSSFIGVFRRNRGEHAFIYFRLGSRDLLLFSDIFKKCTEAVRRKSGISYENIQDKKLVFRIKKTSGSREKCTTFIHVRHVNKKSASRSKGKIEVRCPKCGTTFIKKS